MVFAVDGTNNVDWNAMRNFMVDVTQGLDVNSGRARVGVSTFTDSVSVPILINSVTQRESLLSLIRNLQKPRESAISNIESAIETSRNRQFQTLGDRQGIKNVLILLTDGGASTPYNTLVSTAGLAWQDGISIFAVGIGDRVRNEEIMGISTPPQTMNQDYWLIRSFNDLRTLAPNMVNAVCQASTSTTPLPPPPSTQGMPFGERIFSLRVI